MSSAGKRPVTLSNGTRIGPYEVVAPLGAGGMGEVYRARDSRLGREVALKVLPQAFAADEEYMVRFKREAQLLACLDHPNIDRRRVAFSSDSVLHANIGMLEESR